MLFDLKRGLEEGTSGLYSVQTHAQLMKRCKFATRYHRKAGYIHPQFMLTVHEANMKEFEAADDGEEASDSPLIRQYRVIKSSSRSLSEIDEILLQRDYTKEAFCILFQNGQAACIVQRGGRSKPGDLFYYLNDLIYHKDS